MVSYRWLVFLAFAWLAPANAAASGIVVLGDSLSAGYGLSDDQGWVQLLRNRLDRNGYPHEVVNASISGDTTRNALARLDETLARHEPAVVIVEIGGNDGLRGLPIDTIEANLREILRTIRENSAKIVLAGIRIPPNYGPDYAGAFEALYPALASRFDAALIPFFLEGVATDPALMQDDGIHPNAAAQPVLLDNVWPVLETVLGSGG